MSGCLSTYSRLSRVARKTWRPGCESTGGDTEVVFISLLGQRRRQKQVVPVTPDLHPFRPGKVPPDRVSAAATRGRGAASRDRTPPGGLSHDYPRWYPE